MLTRIADDQNSRRERQPPNPAAQAGAIALQLRLAIPCPQCGTAIGYGRRNYKGQHCHPHGARRLTPARPPTAEPPTANEACEEEALDRAFPGRVKARKREADTWAHSLGTPPPAAEAAPELPSLDTAVEALVARYTGGSAIDATWAASTRLYEARKKAGAA